MLSCKFILLNEIQYSNVCPFISTTLLGIVISCNELQCENAPAPKYSRLSGNSILDNFLSFLKADALISINPFGKETVFKFKQFSKALALIFVTF